jgi:hypothetical protein
MIHQNDCSYRSVAPPSHMMTSRLLVVGPLVVRPPLIIIACYLVFRSVFNLPEDVLLMIDA